MISLEWDDDIYREVLLEEGREEGETQTRKETARRMKEYGDPIDKISVITGLSDEEIEKL